MTRRTLTRAAMLGIGTGWSFRALPQAAKAPKTQPATGYVADFIVNTRYTDLPGEVVELARKSILDGLGLALCGSAAQSGEIVRNYIKSSGLAGSAAPANVAATVIGSSL